MTKKSEKKKTGISSSTAKKEIISVTDFLEKLNKLDTDKYDSFFYRGVSDKEYKLQPSLFRKRDDSAKEKLLMQELLSRQSSAFSEDKTMFERLVRAQHYELPTRLLDLTLNPLIALYFACANWKTGEPDNKHKNGKVSIFRQKREQTQYFDSHKTIILSNLAKLSQGQKDGLRASKENNIPKAENTDITQKIEKPDNAKVIKELTSFIQNEYSGFRAEIDIGKLFPPILVIPQRNNERIIAQQGAFILFGLDEQLLDESKLGEALSGEVISYEIRASSKGTILKELKLLGIHLNTLLPGIEHCSHFLMDMLKTEEKTPEENFNLGIMYYFGNGEEKNLHKAREYFQKAAEQGHSLAQYNLAVMYYKGEGGEIDLPKAREYFQKAADQGHPGSQSNLACMYCEGQGGKKDPTKAREYFQKAAEQGHSLAQYNLAVMYYKGEEGEIDLPKAREYYKKAADQGDAKAQLNLALMYYHGEGGDKDYAKAREYFQKAADQEHAKAQFNLAQMLRMGEGGDKDYAKAQKYYKKAAEQGHADAQFNLAQMLRMGEGGDKDYAKAREYYKKAAEQGHADAQFNLAGLYYQGEGRDKDLTKAREYFQKAAERGDADAQYNLAVMYNNGEGGEEDLLKARQYFTKAAEQGVAQAQFNLAQMLRMGEGEEIDLTKAREYFQKAADQGHEKAIEALKKLDDEEKKSDTSETNNEKE